VITNSPSAAPFDPGDGDLLVHDHHVRAAPKRLGRCSAHGCYGLGSCDRRARLRSTAPIALVRLGPGTQRWSLHRLVECRPRPHVAATRICVSPTVTVLTSDASGFVSATTLKLEINRELNVSRIGGVDRPTERCNGGQA